MMINLQIPLDPSGNGLELDLPAELTKKASKQTYYTFLLLVQRRLLKNAFRAYAYFRWVDDQLDCNTGTRQEKLAFLNRQQELIEVCYRNEPHSAVCPEEQMLVNMIEEDHVQNSSLQLYIRNMMAVMSFDVQRKGRLITQAELANYSHLLSLSVTELLFYLICKDDPSPRNEARYHAVQGAHIAHMLRDMWADIGIGYINVPVEILESGQVSQDDLHSPAFRYWVSKRVRLARQYFSAGRRYFSRVKNIPCRLAAYAYLARFEWMLRAIEEDNYYLRRAYPERKSFRAGLWMVWRVFLSFVGTSGLERSDILVKQSALENNDEI